MEVNGIVELNGVKYKVEKIEGKGECLVPVKPLLVKDVGHKVIRSTNDNKLYLVKPITILSTDEYTFICLSNDMAIYSQYKGNSKLSNLYEVVADSLSDAIQKGLIK